MTDNEPTVRTRMDVQGAVDRLSVYVEAPPSKWAKLNPRNWSPTAKTVATAGVTAAFVAAKVPAAVAAAIASFLFGGP